MWRVRREAFPPTTHSHGTEQSTAIFEVSVFILSYLSIHLPLFKPHGDVKPDQLSTPMSLTRPKSWLLRKNQCSLTEWSQKPSSVRSDVLRTVSRCSPTRRTQKSTTHGRVITDWPKSCDHACVRWRQIDLYVLGRTHILLPNDSTEIISRAAAGGGPRESKSRA